MKNRALIVHLITKSAPLDAENIATLIMCLKPELRENAAHIVCGLGRIRAKPIEEVNISYADENKQFLRITDFIEDPLEGKVKGKAHFSRPTKKWYLSEEEAARGSSDWARSETDSYKVCVETFTEDYNSFTIPIEVWNSGNVVLDRSML